jgi:hypothetical protein
MSNAATAIPTKLKSVTSQVDLSIVIVNWNTLSLLRDCLRSVLDNAGKLCLEVFVIDNASTDGSAEMVSAEFSSVKLIRNTSNRGFAAANNQALEIGQGRYLLLLNSDTIVLGDVLEKSVQYADEHPDVGTMGCRVLNPDRTLQPTCFEYPTLLNLFLLTAGLSRLSWPRFLGKYHMTGWKRDSERDVDVVTGCYMLVRYAAMSEIGLLDESFYFFGEETDWCKRFRENGWAVRFAPVGEIVHYGGASAKKLNHRRDVMLTGALIDFHRKHGGAVAALAAWTILWVFNFSRYIGWLFASVVDRQRAAPRRDHFRNILKDYPSPRPKTEKTG